MVSQATLLSKENLLALAHHEVLDGMLTMLLCLLVNLPVVSNRIPTTFDYVNGERFHLVQHLFVLCMLLIVQQQFGFHCQ
jgi:hypothetical protein